MRNETKILVGIILLSYILQTLPYLLGYNLPITPDSLKDFWQVNNLIEHKKINLNDHYAVFPILHLLVYIPTLIGFHAMKTFLFLPQIFPSIGLIFFYKFLKKHFNKKQSLISTFIIAVFPLHVYWSSQPTRETIGLFFFPLILYLFQKEIEKPNLHTKIQLSLSTILLIATHHWSTIMLCTFLYAYTLIILKKEDKKKAIKYLILTTTLALTYWMIFLPFLFDLIFRLLEFIIPISIAGYLSYKSYQKIRKIGLEKFKNNKTRNLLYILAILSLLFLTQILPFNYPPQTWLIFTTYTILTIYGFSKTQTKNEDNFTLITLTYLLFLTIPIAYRLTGRMISRMPFDPLRIFEFIIYPLAPIIAAGIMQQKKKTIILTTYLILLSPLIYPTIFTFKKTFEDTPFYDIRSDIRYLPAEGIEILEWAHINNYKIYTANDMLNIYQNTFYELEGKEELILISIQDEKLLKKQNQVNDPKLAGIWRLKKTKALTENATLIYKNKWAKLYKPDEKTIINVNYPE